MILLFLTFVCRNRSPCQTTLVKKTEEKQTVSFGYFHLILGFKHIDFFCFCVTANFFNCPDFILIIWNLSMFRLLFYRLAQWKTLSILLDDRHIQSSFSFNSKSSIVLIIDKILQNTIA
jgi:hypothetical protein